MVTNVNAAVETIWLTPDGWRHLNDELEALRTHRRVVLEGMPPEGDTRQAGVLELAQLNHRIDELERILKRAVPANERQRDPSTVGVGSRVRVRWEDGELESYQLVGPPEAAPRDGRISYECPVGRALIGRRVGDAVHVEGAGSASRLEIVAIDPLPQDLLAEGGRPDAVAR